MARRITLGTGRGSTVPRLRSDLSVALLAVLDLGLQRTTVIVVEAFAQEDTWRAGLRSALVGVLRFLDSDLTSAWHYSRFWISDSSVRPSLSLRRSHRRTHGAQDYARHWSGFYGSSTQI